MGLRVKVYIREKSRVMEIQRLLQEAWWKREWANYQQSLWSPLERLRREAKPFEPLSSVAGLNQVMILPCISQPQSLT